MEQEEVQPVILPSTKREVKTTSYLTQDNIEGLMNMFSTEEAYRYYMKCLWILRDLAQKSGEIKTPAGWTMDKNAKSFPIYKTANDFIGCLLQAHGHFDASGDLHIYSREQ